MRRERMSCVIHWRIPKSTNNWYLSLLRSGELGKLAFLNGGSYGEDAPISHHINPLRPSLLTLLIYCEVTDWILGA